jgi:hypothetical protein
MTKEEFEVLQLDLQQCGKSVKDYLQEAGVNYSTYNYWRKKLLVKDDSKPGLVPISFMLAVNYSNTPLKMELLSQPRRLQMKYSSPRTIDMSVFDSLSVALVYKKEFSCLVVVANNKQSDRLRNPCLC